MLQDEPEIEKVRGGRRAATAVLVGAVVVVGALIWKPWDTQGGAPETTAVAVLPSPSPAQPATPFVFEAPPATPLVHVAPGATPQLPQQQPGRADEHFAAVLLASKGPYVRCTYGPGFDARDEIVNLSVAPPIVTFGHGGKSDLVRTIVLRPELEANTLQGIFSAEWHFVTAGRAQRWPLSRGPDVDFRQTRLKPSADALTNSGVFRVAVVVTWIGDAGEVLERQRLYPTSYAVGDVAQVTPEGCPARITDRPRFAN